MPFGCKIKKSYWKVRNIKGEEEYIREILKTRDGYRRI